MSSKFVKRPCFSHIEYVVVLVTLLFPCEVFKKLNNLSNFRKVPEKIENNWATLVKDCVFQELKRFYKSIWVDFEFFDLRQISHFSGTNFNLWKITFNSSKSIPNISAVSMTAVCFRSIDDKFNKQIFRWTVPDSSGQFRTIMIYDDKPYEKYFRQLNSSLNRRTVPNKFLLCIDHRKQPIYARWWYIYDDIYDVILYWVQK